MEQRLTGISNKFQMNTTPGQNCNVSAVPVHAVRNVMIECVWPLLCVRPWSSLWTHMKRLNISVAHINTFFFHQQSLHAHYFLRANDLFVVVIVSYSVNDSHRLVLLFDNTDWSHCLRP